jgi:outer membrane protein assembly factor BamB
LGEDLGNLNFWNLFLSSPSIVDQNIYVGSGSGYLFDIDLNTKKRVWKFNAGSRIRTTPAIADNRVVFGTMEGYVIA